MKTKLTEDVVASATYQGDNGRRFVIWDTAVLGFGLRVYPKTNGKSYVVSFRINGKPKLMIIGDADALRVRDARAKARVWIGDAAKGVDRGAKLSDAKLSGVPTFKEACESYMSEHARIEKKSWKDDQRRIDLHLLPAWGRRKVTSVKPSDVRKLYMGIRRHAKFEANRVAALCSAIFNYTMAKDQDRDYLPVGFANPAKGVRRTKAERNEAVRTRTLTPAEFVRLSQAILQEKDVYTRGALLVLRLTGLRKSEVLKLTWDGVDLEGRTAFIAAPKNGQPRYITLPPEACQILGDLPREEGNPYCFPSPRRKGQPLADLKSAWTRIRRASGLTDIRIHDLRRSLATDLLNDGTPLAVVAKILGHSDPSITAKVYASVQDATQRAALDGHAASVVSMKDWIEAKESEEDTTPTPGAEQSRLR